MGMNKVNELSNRIIGLALEVHKKLGPGLLESVYQQCLAYELSRSNVAFVLEQPIPIKYKTVTIGFDYQLQYKAFKFFNLCELCVLGGENL